MMRLIEVVRGIETSEDTVETTLEIAKRMGKEVVLLCRFPRIYHQQAY